MSELPKRSKFEVALAYAAISVTLISVISVIVPLVLGALGVEELPAFLFQIGLIGLPLGFLLIMIMLIGSVSRLSGSEKGRRRISFGLTLLLIPVLSATAFRFVFEPWPVGYVFFISILTASLFAFLGNLIAKKAEAAGRSWMAFYWLTILTSPIVTWIIVATLSQDKSVKASSQKTGQDTIDSIQRLAKLRDEGILSDDEFQAKKTELLKNIDS